VDRCGVPAVRFGECDMVSAGDGCHQGGVVELVKVRDVNVG
jgi:hypothetical protein